MKQSLMIEVEVPEGYKAIGFGKLQPGKTGLYEGKLYPWPLQVPSDMSYILLEKEKEVPKVGEVWAGAASGRPFLILKGQVKPALFHIEGFVLEQSLAIKENQICRDILGSKKLAPSLMNFFSNPCL